MWIGTGDSDADAFEDIVTLPDRASAIVAVAVIDDRLTVSIKQTLPNAHLKGSTTIHDAMFSGMGPLSSLSAKINLGFMIGLYSETALKNLHVLRAIRNKFAHDVAVRTFQDVRDDCNNLVEFEKHFFERGTRSADTPPIANPMVAVTDLEAKLKDPRSRFVLCTQVYGAGLFLRSSPPGI
jgi:hypothetical protein